MGKRNEERVYSSRSRSMNVNVCKRNMNEDERERAQEKRTWTKTWRSLLATRSSFGYTDGFRISNNQKPNTKRVLLEQYIFNQTIVTSIIHYTTQQIKINW